MPKDLTAPEPGILSQLQAAADAGNLDERGIPKKLGTQYRRTEAASYDKATRTVTMAVSSSTPVDRYFGTEILSHEKGAVRTDRLKGGVSLLFNHDYGLLLGRTQSFEIGDPIHVTARFGTSALAIEKEGDVEAKVLVDVSIGYQVYEWEITEDKNGQRTYLAVDWEIYEVSLVTVPADPTVGVGRDAKDVKVRSFTSARKLDADADARGEDDEDEKDEDDDEEDEDAERSLPAATPTLDPATPTPTPETRNIMAEVTEVVDHAAINLARVTELRSLHTLYPEQFPQRALKDAEDLGAPVDKVKERIFEARIAEAQRSDIPTVASGVLAGMTDKDLRSYTVGGAYRAAANLAKKGTFTGARYEGGFEFEVGQTIKKAAEAEGVRDLGAGVPIPSLTALSQARAQRTITSGGNAGTAFNYTTVDADPIELLRYATALLTLGARYRSGLQGKVQMTKQTGAATSSWLLEGAAVSPTDPTFGFFTMQPNRLSMASAYDRTFLTQAALAIEPELSADRREVLSRSLDTAGIAGSGVAPIPKGLLNMNGLAAILSGSTRANDGTYTAGAGAKPMTYVDYNNLEALISTANAAGNGPSILTTPRVKAAGRTTAKLPGFGSDVIWPDAPVGQGMAGMGPLGMRSVTTSNPVLTGFTSGAATNCHAVIMGDFSQFIIADWGLSELIADNITGAATNVMTFWEHAYYDVNVRHIESFAACTTVLPS